MTTTTDTWTLRDDRFLEEQASWKESIFTIANGYLSTRGTFEETRSGEIRGTFINGLFVTPPGELPVLGAVPDWTHFQLMVDGNPFHLQSPPAGYERTLDLRNGVLSRTVLWRGSDTGVVRIQFRRLVSMASQHLAALEVRITAITEPVSLEIETGLDANIPSPNVPVWLPAKVSQIGPDRFAAGYRSVDDQHRLTVESALRGPLSWRFFDHDIVPRMVATVELDRGNSVAFTKYVLYHADRDQGELTKLPSAEITFDVLAEQSSLAWAKRWQSSTISVGGDPEAELAAHFGAFHLIGSASSNDVGSGIGGRLMSGFGYRHHVFWDTDIAIAPYLTLTQPDLARVHMGYRYRGLEGARRKAKHYGREGAFYAWESAGTGDEVTPEWAHPPFGPPIRIWTGELEEHITADVAWSADHFSRWTGSDRFLADEGAEMIIDGARYWASRLNLESDGAHIRDVIGPDEYHIHIDDSLYTNLLAAWQLRRAAELIEWLGRRHPQRLAELRASLGFELSDVDRYRTLADRMVLHQRPDGVWEQSAGFFDLETIDLEAFNPRLRSMYDLLGEERLQQVAVLKQPDVLMASVLAPELIGDLEVRRRNWDYYEPKTDHGSSMSIGFHSLVAAQMGDAPLAYDHFRRAIAIDLEDSMSNGQHGVHAACQGAILQTLLFGFGGLSLHDGAPVTNAILPDHWQSLDFSFFHAGELRDASLTNQQKDRGARTSPRRTRKKGKQ